MLRQRVCAISRRKRGLFALFLGTNLSFSSLVRLPLYSSFFPFFPSIYYSSVSISCAMYLFMRLYCISNYTPSPSLPLLSVCISVVPYLAIDRCRLPFPNFYSLTFPPYLSLSFLSFSTSVPLPSTLFLPSLPLSLPTPPFLLLSLLSFSSSVSLPSTLFFFLLSPLPYSYSIPSFPSISLSHSLLPPFFPFSPSISTLPPAPVKPAGVWP